MPIGLAYWIIMLVWVVFYLLTAIGPYGHYMPYLIVVQVILFLLLGWQVFGRPLR